MSEEVKKAAETVTPPPADDRIKNLQAEVSRKFDNFSSKFEKSISDLATLIKPPAPKAKESKLSDLIYENPDEFARRVMEQAESNVEKKLNDRQGAQNRQNAVLQTLANSYPEITDSDHPLTKLAIEKYDSMSADEKASPAAYKAAVAEAAIELDIKPKSKRPKSDDDSYVGAGSSGSRRASKQGIAPETAEFAKLLGVDPKKVEERVKSRKSFTRYE